MHAMKKAVIVGCSDPLPQSERDDVRRLPVLLAELGADARICPLLLAPTPPSPREKAEALNRYFRDPDVELIFDASGGDLANTVLPYLDWDAIRASRAVFFGFSDLSVVLNAIVAKTGRPAVNYQIRNLLYEDRTAQRAFFREKLLPGAFTPDDLAPVFLRGTRMRGRVIGGNVRCFLKLAGTPYWPDPDGAVLLLESLGGGVNQMITALEQYRQLGVFDRVNGILLGTFTKMEREGLRPTIEELTLAATPDRVAVAGTRLVGHAPDARAIRLGETVCIAAKREASP